MENERSPVTPNSDSYVTSRSLLQRALDHQPDAWQRLVILYDPLVRHWCRRGGVAFQDLDDVAQEVFSKVFAALDTFRRREASDSFRGWLYGLTRHRMLEHFRRAGRHIAAAGGSEAQALILNRPGPETDSHGAPDQEERILYGELYRRALEFIRGEFEPRTWQMFWRSVVDALPTSVVAAELTVSDASVRQARSRVLRRLRQEAAELDLEVWQR
jgi:RNA polymerase sigma-70 factor, ECF subfamily